MEKTEANNTVRNFGEDVAFLARYTTPVVLQSPDGQAKIAVAPEYQGRVMTSTATGDAGFSFGWINYEVVADGTYRPHINVFGGEERFWFGPEGGQFSIFFKPGEPMDLDHWQTPPAIDWGAWDITSCNGSSVAFFKAISLRNYAGTTFDFDARREVKLLSAEAAGKELGISLASDIKLAAYETVNSIENTGSRAWTQAGGLISIWMLGMFKPSPTTTIILPFKGGSEAELGPTVNDSYFGKVPADRIKIDDAGFIFFSGDGKYRSKIGISRPRAKNILGSYDSKNQVLTLIKYDLPPHANNYVNSMWEELQAEPFSGDVVNSYNDGPASPGAKPLGPFYELETSSPAAELRPGESMIHVSRTFHLQASPEQLDAVVNQVLGIKLDRIMKSL